MSELHRISNGGETPQADVIFVHGLGGDPFSTWWHDSDRPKDSWPFWLAEDLPEAAVHCLKYEASPSHWLGRSMPLTDRATNVLTVLETQGIGSRPIVFVCHSLGGLLVKQMLRHARDTSVEAWRAIAAETKAVVFLATPHSGSDYATWLHRLGTLVRASSSIEDLQAHGDHLRNLNIWYRENATALGIATHSFFEAQPSRIGMIVDPTSADPGITGVVPRSVDTDHRSICKPRSRRDLVYQYVLQRVQKCRADAIELRATRDRPRTLQQLGEGSRSQGKISGTSKTLSTLEALQFRVSSWDGRSDNADGSALYEECKRFVDTARCGDDPLADYAVLVEGHALMKDGAQLIHENRSRIGYLVQQARNRTPEGAAASWQLARIRLAQASEEQPWQQRELLESALKHFKQIPEGLELRYPVLLPGIRSESSESKLIIDDRFLGDPRIQVLPIPYRYCAATLISLSDINLTLADLSLDQERKHVDDARKFLEIARDISTRAVELFREDSPHVILNLELVELSVDTFIVMRFQSRKRKGEIRERWYRLLEKIKKAEADRHLPSVKKLEWTGQCWAAIAYLAESHQEHANDLRRFHEHISQLRQIAPRHTDWLTVDAIYRLAHTTPEEQMYFRRLIKSGPT
jgi:pimeloyl-ACP methyl ester carboxylesterase